MLVFDIETNGLLPGVDKVHCLVILDTDTLDIHVFNNEKTGRPIAEGLAMLEAADCICGQNIVEYDLEVLYKMYPGFNPKGVIRDTTIMSRLIFADMAERDFKYRKKHPEFPGRLIGSHSLEAWGARLKFPKDTYSADMKAKGLDPWAAWNQDMEDYCVQDVKLTHKLYKVLMKQEFSEESIQLEHDVRRIILRQEKYGVLFNEEKAVELYTTLVGIRESLSRELKSRFKPWYTPRERFVPKGSNQRLGYTAGCPLTKVELTEFNPASRDHIAYNLIKHHQWKPTAFTDKGRAKVDEEVLEGLKFDVAPLLLQYLLVEKRIGQLAEGSNAWLKLLKVDGRIHGRVNTNGAVTGRMTHNSPNLAQTPAVYSPYGAEMRGLFIVPKGKSMVGADASGLELRNLAHYMARWDKGAYSAVILEGDIHTENQKAAGLPSRDNAKTFIYAFLYGAGDMKIGSIVGKGAKAGKYLKEKFLTGLPALGALKKAVESKVKRGYLLGLDGRKVYIRHSHAALNTLLQSAGAIVMKKALVILDDLLQADGYKPGVNYEFILNVHDEWQIECDEGIAERVGQLSVDAIRKAGEHYKYRCPLDGDYKIGRSWAETH